MKAIPAFGAMAAVKAVPALAKESVLRGAPGDRVWTVQNTARSSGGTLRQWQSLDINDVKESVKGVEHVIMGYSVTSWGANERVFPIELSSDHIIIDGFMRYRRALHYNKKQITAFVRDTPFKFTEYREFNFGEDIKQKVVKGETGFGLSTYSDDTRVYIDRDADDPRTVLMTLNGGEQHGWWYPLDEYTFDSVMEKFVDLVNWNRYGKI